jgi:hypothetical protein
MHVLSFAAAMLTLGVEPAPAPPAPQVKRAIERSLDFLTEDALKWKIDKKRACATCHHGTMTVWVLSEAKAHGFAVRSETLKELIQWTKGRFVGGNLDAPKGGPTENISMAPVYLALLPRTTPNQESLSGDELKRIAGYLKRWQEPDGSWNGPNQKEPAAPFFESVEVITLLGYLALEAQVLADPETDSPFRASRDLATDWLRKTKPAESTQSMVLRLLVEARTGALPKNQPGIGALLDRQNADGGWGQEKGLPSDAYATGQALYALSLAGLAMDHRTVSRGVAFLLGTQAEDGSWPMKSRKKKSSDPVPITYFGCTWATLGLMRSMPK